MPNFAWHIKDYTSACLWSLTGILCQERTEQNFRGFSICLYLSSVSNFQGGCICYLERKSKIQISLNSRIWIAERIENQVKVTLRLSFFERALQINNCKQIKMSTKLILFQMVMLLRGIIGSGLSMESRDEFKVISCHVFSLAETCDTLRETQISLFFRYNMDICNLSHF